MRVVCGGHLEAVAIASAAVVPTVSSAVPATDANITKTAMAPTTTPAFYKLPRRPHRPLLLVGVAEDYARVASLFFSTPKRTASAASKTTIEATRHR